MIFRTTLIGIAILLLSSPCYPASEAYLCYDYSNQLKNDLAINECTKAIALNPKDSSTYINRGNAYLNKGQLDQAITDFSKAIELNPKSERAYNNRGNAYAEKGQLDQAITDYSKVIELNPGYVSAYNDRGGAYAKKGQLDQAIADFNKAIELNPRLEKPYINRGNAYLNKGQLDQAITDFNKAIELNPRYEKAYNNRGNAYMEKGQMDQAIADFSRTIDLVPTQESADYAFLKMLIAKWLAKAPDADIIDRFRQYISSNPSEKWVRIISRYYLGIEKVSEDSVLAEAKKGKNEKEIQERLCETYYYLAMKRLTNGNKKGATDFFAKSVETNERNFIEYKGSKRMLALLKEGKL